MRSKGHLTEGTIARLDVLRREPLEVVKVMEQDGGLSEWAVGFRRSFFQQSKQEIQLYA